MRDGYLSSFRNVVFSACPSMCSNTSFPRLNFLFMPTWKSKVAKLFVIILRWVVGSQLNIAILCKIEYLEVRWEE